MGTFLAFQFPIASKLISAAAAPALVGAAKTASGLATLGGGSVASGGWGMAGGKALLTGVSLVASAATKAIIGKRKRE